MKTIGLLILFALTILACNSPDEVSPSSIEGSVKASSYASDTLSEFSIVDSSSGENVILMSTQNSSELFYQFDTTGKGIRFQLDDLLRVVAIQGYFDKITSDSLIYSIDYFSKDSLTLYTHLRAKDTRDLTTIADSKQTFQSGNFRKYAFEDSLSSAVINLQTLQSLDEKAFIGFISAHLRSSVIATQALASKVQNVNIQTATTPTYNYWERIDLNFPAIFLDYPRYQYMYREYGYEKQLFRVNARMICLHGRKLEKLVIKYSFDDSQTQLGCGEEGVFEYPVNRLKDVVFDERGNMDFYYLTWYAWGSYCSPVPVYEEIVAVMTDGTKSNYRRIYFKDQLN